MTTVLGSVHLAPGEMTGDVAELCRGLAEDGLQQVVFNMPNVHEIDPLRVFGRDIIPAVSGF